MTRVETAAEVDLHAQRGNFDWGGEIIFAHGESDLRLRAVSALRLSISKYTRKRRDPTYRPSKGKCGCAGVGWGTSITYVSIAPTFNHTILCALFLLLRLGSCNLMTSLSNRTAYRRSTWWHLIVDLPSLHILNNLASSVRRLSANSHVFLGCDITVEPPGLALCRASEYFHNTDLPIRSSQTSESSALVPTRYSVVIGRSISFINVDMQLLVGSAISVSI